MPSMDNEPTPEARANVTRQNVESRAELLPEEQSVEGRPDPSVAEAQAEVDPGRVGGADRPRRPRRRPGRPPPVGGDRGPALTGESGRHGGAVHEHRCSCAGRIRTSTGTSTTPGR